jgi:hypothetical protein
MNEDKNNPCVIVASRIKLIFLANRLGFYLFLAAESGDIIHYNKVCLCTGASPHLIAGTSVFYFIYTVYTVWS